MNPQIPMMAEIPDLAGAISRGRQGFQQQQEYQRANELRGFMQENGPAILAGEPNALAGLAAFDPEAAMAVQGQQLGMQSQRLGMDQTRLGMDATRQDMANQSERMAMARQQAEQAARESAAQMSQMERENTVRTLTQMLPAFQAIKTPEEWDRAASQVAPDMVGQFTERESLFAMGEGMIRGFTEPQAPVKLNAGDTLLDPNNNYAPLASVPANEPPAMQSLRLRASEAGLQPGTPQYQAFMQEGDRPKTTISNIGNQADPGANSEFYKELDKKDAANFATVLETAPLVGRVGAQIDQLGQLLDKTPTGLGAAGRAKLGEWGLPVEGLDDVQALQAAINAMVPGQRPPGSGTMSDADLALFKSSIPSIINQPGGNAKIISTMRDLNNYDQQMVEIAGAVANRAMTPAEGRDRMMAVPNPLEGFSRPSEMPGTGGKTGRTNTGIEWSID